jgi:2-polyprenyl-3-methyl-5-hydroxy-6-metoxy-1,4-benzoquinol methylase
MLTSYAENILPILQAIKRLEPKNVLDVGAGFGKFGLLTRELLLAEAAEAGDLSPKPKFKINCIEAAGYFMDLPWHRSLYDRHFHADLFQIPPSIFAEHDLILMIDVVEHTPKDRMLKLLQDIKAEPQAKGRTKILISTPRTVVFYPQVFYGSAGHISQWEAADFKAFPRVTDLGSKFSHLVVIE